MPKKSTNLYPAPFLYAWLAILAWSPLPLASNRPWSLNLLCLLIFMLAFCLAAYSMLKSISPIKPLYPHRVSIGLLAFVALWSTCQTIMLPSGIIETLSPAAADLYAGADLAHFSLSLDPAETKRLALFSWCLCLFFVMTILLVDYSRRVRTVFMVIVLGGVFQALYGSFMTLSGLEYGFFMKKTAYLGRATGTFVNRNHLAGYLEMCLAVGIGLMVGSLHRTTAAVWRAKLGQGIDTLLGPKMRLRVFLALMVIALVLTRSRMGNSAFFIALPACGVLFMAVRRKLHKGALVLIVSLMLVDFFIVGQWFGFEEVVDRLENTSTETETRDEVIRDTWRMLQEYPLTGTGLGTYYSAFPQFQGPDVRGFYDHAHNDYLEFALELGLIGFLPLAALVLLSLYQAIRTMARRHDSLARGVAFAATMGMISLLIHSLVDFNLHIPANALMFITMLAFASISVTLPRDGSRNPKRKAKGEKQ